MKKYLTFIIFFTLFAFGVSVFVSTKVGNKFLYNPENDFSYLDAGYKVDFEGKLHGKLYFSDTRPTIFYLNPTWRQMVNIYYCESETCILSKKYAYSNSIENYVIKNKDYDKTNEVTLKTYTYYDVFGKYDLSYSGWKTRYIEHKVKNELFYDLTFVPQKDDTLNSCVWLTTTKRKWYKIKKIDISKSNWYKKNVKGTNGWDFSKDEYESIWDNPETIKFEAKKGDILQLQLKVSPNSTTLFFIDGISAEPITMASTMYKSTDLYYNYEFDINSSGDHYVTIVHVSNMQITSNLKKLDEILLPYVYINRAEVHTYINEGRNLDTTGLKNGDTVMEQFECNNGFVEDRSIVYTTKKNK